MRRKRSAQLGEKSLSIALFFVLLVVLLVGLSIALKIFLLFHAAKFDGEHQFILELHTPSQKELVSFDPDTNSAFVLSTKDQVSSFGEYAGIPVDSSIATTENDDSLYTLVQNMLFHPPEHFSLNIIDRIRLFLFVNNVKPTNISNDQWSGGKIDDQKLTAIFTDHTAYTENLSLAIVNASGVSGLGNKIASELTHIGLNIISVTSAQQLSERSSIVYSGKAGYTTKRLSHIFSLLPRQSQSPMLSDITVTIGKDLGDKL